MSNVFEPGSGLLISITAVVDAFGRSTKFQNPPVWTSSDPTILPLTAAPDGLSATGTSLQAGTVTVTAVGDGISESVTITLAAGAVASFSLVVTQLAAPPAPPANP